MFPLLVGAVMAVSVSAPALAAVPRATSSSVNANYTSPDLEVTPAGPLGPVTDLVIRRLLIGDQVAAAKFGTDKPIDDPVREQQELDSIRKSAESLGIDPVATAAFFQQQITASKIVQQGLFDRWTAHPAEAPTTRPDLAEIRDQLDQLTTDLLQQLVAHRQLLATAGACELSLRVAQVTGEVFRHLDGLHRRALTTALSSTCTK
ncbi:gamma subclass chorismate mutase AroQ [Amycolatopsis sp. NPDC004368]